jgi:hypothetical protein
MFLKVDCIGRVACLCKGKIRVYSLVCCRIWHVLYEVQSSHPIDRRLWYVDSRPFLISVLILDASCRICLAEIMLKINTMCLCLVHLRFIFYVMAKYTIFEHHGNQFDCFSLNSITLDILARPDTSHSTQSYANSPPIYMQLIFAILQFEISNLMNRIFFPSLNWIFLPAVACKIQVWSRLKIKFIKLDIFKLENWKNQVQIDGGILFLLFVRF